MLIIYNDQSLHEPVAMSSIHIGDNKGIYSKPIFISTEVSEISTTIEFSDQPYGYPDISTMFWTGSALILVETDDKYVSANDYFKKG